MSIRFQPKSHSQNPKLTKYLWTRSPNSHFAHINNKFVPQRPRLDQHLGSSPPFLILKMGYRSYNIGIQPSALPHQNKDRSYASKRFQVYTVWKLLFKSQGCLWNMRNRWGCSALERRKKVWHSGVGRFYTPRRRSICLRYLDQSGDRWRRPEMPLVEKATQKGWIHMPNSRLETGALQKISSIKKACWKNWM